MTKEDAIEKFKERLDKQYLDEFENGALLSPGRILKWTNLNSTFDIEILSFDGIVVTFKLLGNYEKNIFEFTIDNFYIHNPEYVEDLYENNSRKYDKLDIETLKKQELDFRGIYILSNESEKIIYIGQAEHVGWRMLDHIHESSNQKIDKEIRKNMNIKMKVIKLEDTSYSNLDALECAFITHYDTFKNGLNETRGNNGPGNNQITTDLIC